jgi:hypothetical protein
VAPGLKPLYDAYSFKVLPLLGDWWRATPRAIAIWRSRSACIRTKKPCSRCCKARASHPDALSQFDRRHRRRASRLQDLTCRQPRLAGVGRSAAQSKHRRVERRRLELARRLRAPACKSMSRASPGSRLRSGGIALASPPAMIPPADAVISGSACRRCCNLLTAAPRGAGRAAPRADSRRRRDRQSVPRTIHRGARPIWRRSCRAGSAMCRRGMSSLRGASALGAAPAHGRRKHRRVPARKRAATWSTRPNRRVPARRRQRCAKPPIGSRRGCAASSAPWGGG